LVRFASRRTNLHLHRRIWRQGERLLIAPDFPHLPIGHHPPPDFFLKRICYRRLRKLACVLLKTTPFLRETSPPNPPLWQTAGHLAKF
jgi:hypothetical protein